MVEWNIMVRTYRISLFIHLQLLVVMHQLLIRLTLGLSSLYDFQFIISVL